VRTEGSREVDEPNYSYLASRHTETTEKPPGCNHPGGCLFVSQISTVASFRGTSGGGEPPRFGSSWLLEQSEGSEQWLKSSRRSSPSRRRWARTVPMPSDHGDRATRWNRDVILHSDAPLYWPFTGQKWRRSAILAQQASPSLSRSYMNNRLRPSTQNTL